MTVTQLLEIIEHWRKTYPNLGDYEVIIETGEGLEHVLATNVAKARGFDSHLHTPSTTFRITTR